MAIFENVKNIMHDRSGPAIMTYMFSIKFHSLYDAPCIYAARERCNNACLMVFSLRFSTKYGVVLCSIRLCAIAVVR